MVADCEGDYFRQSTAASELARTSHRVSTADGEEWCIAGHSGKLVKNASFSLRMTRPAKQTLELSGARQVLVHLFGAFVVRIDGECTLE